jgi:hypothetical protein
VHVVFFFEPALALLQPLRARLRHRPGFGGAPLVEAALGLAQPAAPPLLRRQLGRQLVAAPLAEALVLGAVDRVGLGQDLASDLLVVEVAVLRGVRVHLRAVHGEHSDADQTGVRAQGEHLAEQARERLLVTLAKARDRAVIGPLVGRDHPQRDIVDARPLDRPRRTPPPRIRVKQQRDHHRRIVRRAPMPVPAIGGIERRQIHLLDRGQHEPRQVVLRQPIAHARRQQQHLLTVTRNEVLRHDRIVQNHPDSRHFMQQPPRKAAVRRDGLLCP